MLEMLSAAGLLQSWYQISAERYCDILLLAFTASGINVTPEVE